MDLETVTRHRELWGTEPEDQRFMGELAHLSDAEQAVFQQLRTDALGPCVRLEQERILYACLVSALAALQGASGMAAPPR